MPRIKSLVLLVLVLSSVRGVAAQDATTRLIVRPTLAFVMRAERSGSATLIDDQERSVRVELDNGRVGFGAQLEINVDAHLFFALGGLSSLHATTTVTATGSLKEDRQLLHFWAGPGLRSRFITVTAGPLLLREVLPEVEVELPGAAGTRICDGGGADVSHRGWTGLAMFEFPISTRASVSLALQRHSIRWNARPIGRDVSRSAVAPACPSNFELPEWRLAITTSPVVYTFQAGVAIPLF